MRAMFGFTKVRYKERRGSTMQSESFGVVGVEWLRAWDLVRRGALGNRGGAARSHVCLEGFPSEAHGGTLYLKSDDI